jgi:hypothetical protein
LSDNEEGASLGGKFAVPAKKKLFLVAGPDSGLDSFLSAARID